MSSILKIVNSFELTAQGQSITGKQGLSTDGITDQFSITVTGASHRVSTTLATATVVTVYDDDDDVPIDFVYLHLWADQDLYIQIIGSATNATFKVAAKQPFVLPGFDSILAAANTTPISGGSEPSVTDIDSIVLGNYSGSTANYVFTVVL